MVASLAAAAAKAIRFRSTRNIEVFKHERHLDALSHQHLKREVEIIGSADLSRTTVTCSFAAAASASPPWTKLEMDYYR